INWLKLGKKMMSAL
uniref:Mastoparan MP n=1 Tax=Mischocyttarus phthisicus TaxID=256666 RepID=MAST_MISPH|nr:RecName: Full=Mastoparan MP [Mischocyttarus phthisicus]